MTMLTTFTGQFKKNDTTFFADFIGDASPFSVIKSTDTVVSYSNTNRLNEGVIGTVSVTTPSSSGGASTYNFGGVYLSSGTTTVDTAFCLGRGETEIECRMRMAASDPDIEITIGFGIGHNTADNGISNNFVGFHSNCGDSKGIIKLVVVEDRVTKFSTTISGVPSQESVFNTYSVMVNDKADNIVATINGKVVATIPYKIRLAASGTPINYTPSIELRDRNGAGSGLTNASMEIDYIRVSARTNR